MNYMEMKSRMKQKIVVKCFRILGIGEGVDGIRLRKVVRTLFLCF